MKLFERFRRHELDDDIRTCSSKDEENLDKSDAEDCIYDFDDEDDTENSSLRKKAYSNWSKLYLDQGIKARVKELFVKKSLSKNLLKLYEEIIKEKLPASSNEKEVRALLDVINSYVLEEYDEYVFDNKCEKSFEEQFISSIVQALFDVSILFGLDFEKTMDDFLTLCSTEVSNYSSEKYLDLLPTISFRLFTKLADKSMARSYGEEKEDYVFIVEDYLKKEFLNLLSKANAKDIEVLYKFSIREEDSLNEDFARLLYDVLNLSCKHQEAFDFSSEETIRAISEYYPDLCSLAYTAYLLTIISKAKSAKLDHDDENCEYYNSELLKILQDISVLKNYRSEEFSYISSIVSYLVDSIIHYFNGDVLYKASKILHRDFNISTRYIRARTYNVLYFDYLGEPANDSNISVYERIKRVGELLSCPWVYKFVLKEKPSIIEVL